MLKKDQEKVRTGRKKKNVIPFYKPWYVSNGRVNGSPYDPAALGLIGQASGRELCTLSVPQVPAIDLYTVSPRVPSNGCINLSQAVSDQISSRSVGALSLSRYHCENGVRITAKWRARASCG